jgi:hypothetical protein
VDASGLWIGFLGSGAHHVFSSPDTGVPSNFGPVALVTAGGEFDSLGIMND